MSPQFLVVDDDPDVLKAAQLVLSRLGKVDTAASPEHLGQSVRETAYDAVLLDMNFALGERSGREGFAGLEALQTTDPALNVVLMTTYGGVSLAVEALKRGAVDFVLKPWRNDALVAALERAAQGTRERRKGDAGLNLDALEKRAVERALAIYDGNVSRAAQALGLTRPALYRRMERHGLDG